jgi:hypothetical protein
MSRVEELEEQRVEWRYLTAMHAGMTPSDCEWFALSQADIGLLRRLVVDGCPPHLLRRILQPDELVGGEVGGVQTGVAVPA